MIDVKEIIELRDGNDYQRENFDDYLRKIKFSFDLPAVHIAGTNGKGSTATYLASIFQEAGYKVGLYTSPALYEINEMITVNGKQIDDEQIKAIVLDRKKEILKYDLSSFEVLTYVAFEYFKQQKCDICIIECGMGGEVDATNIFDPVLSIITSISLEHTNFLGRSVSEIALQKAGIIKDSVPVLLGSIPEEAIDVIADVAKENNSKIYSVGESHKPTITKEGYQFTYGTIEDIKIQSTAFYSVNDACLAIDAALILRNQFDVTDEQIKSGLAKVKMLCRMEKLDKDPLVIIDGGHNPEAFDKLTISLQKARISGNIRVLLACFKDKNLIQMLSTIGSIADTIVLTTFDHPRARVKDDYFLYLSDYEFIENPIEAFRILKERYPEDTIVITGSLAFAAYMSKRLKDE